MSPPNEDSALPRLRLRVTAAAESRIRSGHPWLFSDSIREQNRVGALGDLAVLYDRQNRFLAIGLFDPESPLRVRILHAGKPQMIDHGWWRGRLEQALARRRGLFDEQTTGYRLINGESDGWPGLVLDRYDATLVMKLYTAAWLPRLDEIVGLTILVDPKPERLVLRLSRNIQELAKGRYHRLEGWLVDATPAGENTNRVLASADAAQFLESGLRFEADVLRGQKTGFFLDQRENRRMVESLSRGRDVLNAFSFTGGFSVYAARGGARSATDLDISDHALAGSRRNFSLNQHIPTVAACAHETIQADVFRWLEEGPARLFDLVILDPPSLARREAERAGAIQAYGQLVRAGIAHLRPAGILVAASCSAHVSVEEFLNAVHRGAARSGRKFAELKTTVHPPDHPATFPEAHYLKCVYLKEL